MFGIVLEWFMSYLEQCSQRVLNHGIFSDVLVLLPDILQSSVLGSLVFIQYTCPIEYNQWQFGVKFHLFADDTQMHISLDLHN